MQAVSVTTGLVLIQRAFWSDTELADAGPIDFRKNRAVNSKTGTKNNFLLEFGL